MPWYVETRLLFYRKDILEKAGITSPPATWDDLKAAAKAMKEKGGSKYGISLGTKNWQEYVPFLWSNGGDIVDASGNPALNSPQAVAALEHMVECVKYSTPGVLSYDFTISTDAFSAGKTAMMLMWSTIAGPVYNSKTSKVAKNVGVAICPGVGSLRGTIVRGGWGMGIPKNAKNKDGAWTLITYLCSREWGKFEVAAHQTDPARKARGIGCFLVECADPTVSSQNFQDPGFKPLGRGSVTMDATFVPDERVIAEPGKGFGQIMAEFDLSRTLIAL